MPSHYFVDEAGDPVLFNRRKQSVAGTPGCSTFFILGLLWATDPLRLADGLASLRASLLADPYFRGVPSMQPAQLKTAYAFHAKDDLPEIRRDVFAELMRHETMFFAVVRDKRRIHKLVREENARQPQYRYHPNQLYDQCVSRLFKERLHKDESYRIVFAKRGTSDRTSALRAKLEQARESFRRSWGITSQAPIEVVPSVTSREPCLQAADYYLWALQRFCERSDDRYLQFVWPKVRLVHDVDDLRHSYGSYYNQRSPLTLEAFNERMPGI